MKEPHAPVGPLRSWDYTRQAAGAARSAAVMTKCGCTTVSASLEEFDATPDPFGDDFDPGA
jgi:hypothetical protein